MSQVEKVAKKLAGEVVPMTVLPAPPMQGMTGPDPAYGYGRRWSEDAHGYTGAPKANGYYGPIGVHGNEIGVATEYGVTDRMNNKFVEMPTIVPGLTRDQLQGTVDAAQIGDRLPPGVVDKAYAHAAMRLLQGKDPYAGPQDRKRMIPAADYQLSGYKNINGVSE